MSRDPDRYPTARKKSKRNKNKRTELEISWRNTARCRLKYLKNEKQIRAHSSSSINVYGLTACCSAKLWWEVVLFFSFWKPVPGNLFLQTGWRECVKGFWFRGRSICSMLGCQWKMSPNFPSSFLFSSFCLFIFSSKVYWSFPPLKISTRL